MMMLFLSTAVDISANSFWRTPFSALCQFHHMTKFLVLQCEPLETPPSYLHINGKVVPHAHTPQHAHTHARTHTHTHTRTHTQTYTHIAISLMCYIVTCIHVHVRCYYITWLLHVQCSLHSCFVINYYSTWMLNYGVHKNKSILSIKAGL